MLKLFLKPCPAAPAHVCFAVAFACVFAGELTHDILDSASAALIVRLLGWAGGGVMALSGYARLMRRRHRWKALAEVRGGSAGGPDARRGDPFERLAVEARTR